MKATKPRWALAFALLQIALLVPAASWGASALQPWGPMKEIEAAARKEGRLVIYSAAGHASPETQRAVSDLFREKYGVSVEWTSLSSSDMIPRVLAEQRTKRSAADVGMFGFGSAYLEFKPRGYLVPILAPSTFEEGVWIQHPAEAKPKDRDWFYIEFALHPGFLINNNLVPLGKEPRNYKDLLDPRWKGKIVLQSPSRPGSGNGWFLSSYKKLGLDYLRALAKQVVLVRTVGDVPTAVARGEYAIGLAPSTSLAPRLLQEGAPVRLVRPKEGSYVTVKGIAAFANVPHPNAAKTFLNWFFAREGQFIVSKNNLTISLRKDVPQDYLRPEFRYVKGEPYMVPDPEDFSIEGQRAMYALAREIFQEEK